MPFPTALTSPDYAKLRGAYESEQFLSLCPNTIIFAARVNQSAFATSFAQVAYDTVTVGAYTDVEVGQTVYLSRTSAIRDAYFRGRVRAAPNTTTLYINETSVDVDDNDYIFVVHDFDVQEKLARPSGNSQLKDWDFTFSKIKPVVTNLQSAYVGVVAGSPEGFTQRFQPTALAGTSGATIASYAFTIASGMTVVAGSASSNDVTIRFNVGFYWLKLVVTDSLGLTRTRRLPVWAVPTDYASQVALGFSGAQLACDLDAGWNASVEAFSGVDSVLDGTLAVIWERERYNGAEGSLVANVQFVGRLRREADDTQSDEQYSQVQSSRLEIEGPGAQLARVTAPLLALVNKTAAARWDEIVNITPWRAAIHLLSEHSTYLDLHALAFDDTSNTFVATGFTTQGDNLLAAVNDLAVSINAALEFARTGEARLVRSARYLTATERNALTTVAAFEAQDYLNTSLDVEHIELVGRVEASGGTYNTINQKVTPLLAIAPGIAQGSGADKSDLHRQILTASATKSAAQSELNTRAANRYAEVNNRTELSVDHPDGYHIVTPSRAAWYTWTLAASENTRGRAFDTSDRWLLESLEVQHDNATGTKTVAAVYRLETGASLSAVAGQGVEYPPPATVVAPIQPIPPISPFPSFPDPPNIWLPPDPGPGDLPPFMPDRTVLTDGNAVTIHTLTHLYAAPDFIAQNAPTWRDVTPGTLSWDIQAHRLVGRAAYALVGNGSVTQPYYNPAVFDGSLWTPGTLVGDTYKAIRATGTLGSLYIYNPATDTDTTGYEDVLQTALGALTHLISPSYPYGIFATTGPAGVYSATGGRTGGGRINGQLTGVVLDGIEKTEASVVIDLGGEFTVRGVNFWYLSQLEFLSGTAFGVHVNFFNNAGSPVAGGDNHTRTAVTTWEQEILSVNVAGVRYIHVGATGGDIIGGLAYIDDIQVAYRDASGLARTAYSTNYAAAFAAPLLVGTTPGSFGGVDTIKIGSLVLAGALGTVMRAVNGGAYSQYGPALPGTVPASFIHIPRRQFGGTLDNTSTFNPHYLLASATLANGSQGVWKVTNSGSLFTDITPQVNGFYGRAVSSECMDMPWWSGAHIAAVLQFGSERHLVTTLDAGANWVDRGTLHASASAVRYRKGDGTMMQLFVTHGKPAYSGNRGGTLTLKEYPESPASAPVLEIQVYS